MTSSLWINPALGVAGDMVLGSLFDLGADQAWVRSQLAAVELPGWSLEVSPTHRRGLVATAVDVQVLSHDHHRPWSQIDAMLSSAALDPRVAEGARKSFWLLGTAEAKVHGIALDEVHFHEVGAVDAIIDILGSWAALVSLGVTQVHSGPIGLGTATQKMAHGIIPVPAPATLELLVGIPTVPVDWDCETATPTGVALLAAMVDTWGNIPAGIIERTGRGAGSKDPDSHANVVTAVLLNAAPQPEPAGEWFTSTMIETNLDDITPEILGHVLTELIALGADDAWISPITMKKSRSAHQLSVLCKPELAPQIVEFITSETGTLGFRQWDLTKCELPRTLHTINLHGYPVRIKVGPHGAKPEYEDLVAASQGLGKAIRQLSIEALFAWKSAQD
jgi:uncharacterized protein (TIGR00299 family) protein